MSEEEHREEPEEQHEEPTPEQEAENEIAAMKEDLEAIKQERNDYLDEMRRMKADFENSRKRLEREKERIHESASERLVGQLLPVLDNLDRALETEGDIREGVRATREQLAGILTEEGLTPISSDGQHFDPAVHEALMSQPSEEYEEGIIVQTHQRGYMLNGKPIRPAKVVVASKD